MGGGGIIERSLLKGLSSSYFHRSFFCLLLGSCCHGNELQVLFEMQDVFVRAITFAGLPGFSSSSAVVTAALHGRPHLLGAEQSSRGGVVPDSLPLRRTKVFGFLSESEEEGFLFFVSSFPVDCRVDFLCTCVNTVQAMEMNTGVVFLFQASSVFQDQT